MINVVSLCDGMSCGQIALKELGIEIGKYYASEIEPASIKVTQYNFPETIQLGDVKEIKLGTLNAMPKIDLIMFGSPCKSLSFMTSGTVNGNGLQGKSRIFLHCYLVLKYLREHNNPDIKFLVENVLSPHKDDLAKMNSLLGVTPVMINSSLFSAQDRKRYYWTNIDMPPLPTQDSPLVLKDILDENVPDSFYYMRPYYDYEFIDPDRRVCARLLLNGFNALNTVNSEDFKSPTLLTCRGGNTQKKVWDKKRQMPRKLTPNEYRKLQTIPEWYKTDCISKTNVYNLCGDGWTVDVIKHILSGLPEYTNMHKETVNDIHA